MKKNDDRRWEQQKSAAPQNAQTPPPVPVGAHDVVREARLLTALADTPVPVPRVIAVAEPGQIVENQEYYEIETNYPQSTPLRQSAGAGADAHAVSVMKEFQTNAIANFKQQNNLAAITPEEVEMFGLGENRKYALGIEYDLHTSPSTVSYVYLIYEDTLGAHPNAYYRTFTFDARSGEGLVLGDFFVSGADYLSTLSEISRDRLVTQIAEVSNIPESELDRSMLDAGTTPDEDNFQTFYLEGDAFVLIFPPYQVGPWVLGMQEVRIPKSELSAILTAEYR